MLCSIFVYMLILSSLLGSVNLRPYLVFIMVAAAHFALLFVFWEGFWSI